MRLQAAAAVVDPPPQPYREHPGDVRFFRDLAERFDEPFDPEVLASGRHVTHRHLTDMLASQDGVRGRTADVIVVAYALPDARPHGVTASHAGLRFGDHVHGFSVSEAGLAAPFTALRILAAFQRSGRARQPVLLVLEQTTLPTRYRPNTGDETLVDSGVLLAFGTTGTMGLGSSPEIQLNQPAERLAERLASLTREAPEDTLLVLGPEAYRRELATGKHVEHTERASYVTSVWLSLARDWQQWRERFGTVVLCDLEPGTNHGCLAVLRRVPEGEADS